MRRCHLGKAGLLSYNPSTSAACTPSLLLAPPVTRGALVGTLRATAVQQAIKVPSRSNNRAAATWRIVSSCVFYGITETVDAPVLSQSVFKSVTLYTCERLKDLAIWPTLLRVQRVAAFARDTVLHCQLRQAAARRRPINSSCQILFYSSFLFLVPVKQNVV